MKYLVALFMLPTVLMAQAPEGQMPPPTFDQLKQERQPIIEQSLPAMKQTRECVSKADTKQALEKCMQVMAENYQALQQQMGVPEGAEAQDMGKIPADFEWNDENKAVMLKNMDFSIQMSTIMLECLRDSNSGEEMGTCMRGKMPAQPER